MSTHVHLRATRLSASQMPVSHLVVPVIRSFEIPIRIWIIDYFPLRFHLCMSTAICAPALGHQWKVEAQFQNKVLRTEDDADVVIGRARALFRMPPWIWSTVARDLHA